MCEGEREGLYIVVYTVYQENGARLRLCVKERERETRRSLPLRECG